MLLLRRHIPNFKKKKLLQHGSVRVVAVETAETPERKKTSMPDQIPRAPAAREPTLLPRAPQDPHQLLTSRSGPQCSLHYSLICTPHRCTRRLSFLHTKCRQVSYLTFIRSYSSIRCRLRRHCPRRLLRHL